MSCNATGGKRRSRKMKGGAGYGFGDPITVGTLSVVPNSTSTPMKPDGTVDAKVAAMDGNTNSLIGGRRRSRKGKSKKGGKKSRKTRGRRSRKMRGGAWSPGNVNAAGVGYGFTGADSAVRGGIAPASAYPARVGGAPMGADGVRSA